MNFAARWAHNLRIEFCNLLGVPSRHFFQEGLECRITVLAQIIFFIIHRFRPKLHKSCSNIDAKSFCFGVGKIGQVLMKLESILQIF